MDLAWQGAGYGSGQGLTSSERQQIRDNVLAGLQSVYAGFLTTFTTTQPISGDYHRLTYGNTTSSSGLYGQADRVDWRNGFKNDNADIYVRNFDDQINAGSFSRATNLTRLATGLYGTSAHELGHNLGLQHYDDYGDPGITPANYSNTGGIQNTHIMATGQTGLTTTQRATPRSFGQLEKVKLEYASGVAPSLGLTVNETNGTHNTQGTAQTLNGQFLPISAINAVNIAGGIGASGQQDWYAVQMTAGSLLTANIMANVVGISSLDSVLTMFNSSGTQMATNDDISFSGNSIFAGGGYSNDSLLLNIPVNTAGTYYIRVNGIGSSTGNYNLLLTGMATVPEPATLITLGIAALGLIRRRTKK
jgi:hypothetical protein